MLFWCCRPNPGPLEEAVSTLKQSDLANLYFLCSSFSIASKYRNGTNIGQGYFHKHFTPPFQGKFLRKRNAGTNVYRHLAPPATIKSHLSIKKESAHSAIFQKALISYI